MAEQPSILIVDDEDLICFVLSNLFRLHGYHTRTARSGEEAIAMIAERSPSLIVLDIRMPGLSGFDVLYRVKQTHVHVPVVLMTALAGVRDAVQSMKAGAFDYIAKPFNNEDMLQVVARALASAPADTSASGIPPLSAEMQSILDVLGPSVPTRALAAAMLELAAADGDVLITGESGTGKKLCARLLHEFSARATAPMYTADCTGADEGPLTELLFGAEEPQSAGPVVRRKGLMELVGAGTLLVAEVGDMPVNLQQRLADTLRTRTFRRMGGATDIPLACRVLCTAGRDRGAEESDATLHPKLLEELHAHRLHLPALRERKEDIPALAALFIDAANRELGKEIAGCSTSARDMLFVYDWPGNVHQLKSTLRRAVLQARGEILDVDDIEIPSVTRFRTGRPVGGGGEGGDAALKEQVRRHIAEIERQMILETLQKTGWNKAKAARTLQITYKTMLKKIQEYDLEEQGQ